MSNRKGKAITSDATFRFFSPCNQTQLDNFCSCQLIIRFTAVKVSHFNRNSDGAEFSFELSNYYECWPEPPVAAAPQFNFKLDGLTFNAATSNPTSRYDQSNTQFSSVKLPVVASKVEPNFWNNLLLAKFRFFFQFVPPKAGNLQILAGQKTMQCNHQRVENLSCSTDFIVTQMVSDFYYEQPGST